MAAYFVLHCRWHDVSRLREYQAGAQASFEGFDVKPLVYDVRSEVLEGESGLPATVILEFPDPDTARAWYRSDAYQAVVGIRLAGSTGVARLVQSVNTR